ncbi:MAG: ergothioneine biosynthesis protein EgtB [Pseudomonadota bacterium]
MQHAYSGAGGQVETVLFERFRAVRARSLHLIEALSAEDCQVQSMPDVSPTKWHLAHTSWFFETFVLGECASPYRPFDASFAYLFNSYYNSVGPMHARPRRGMLTRPSLRQVLDYRRYVDAAMERAWEAIVHAGLAERVELGLQHEEQHQELILTDILHVLSCNPLLPAYRDGLPPPAAPAEQGWLQLGAGLRMIGYHGPGFAFDNEQPRHRVWLDSFEIATQPVTHADYRAFIDDGGYADPLLWLADGWALRTQEGWQRPLYWSDDNTHVFGLYGVQPIDPQAPVCHLSYYEADAYSRWAGARLPTEAEWETAMTETAALQHSGQVWEWTSSAYNAYPGFRPAAGAVGEYNGKFMCNQFVLRGGSCATPPGHARVTYRNFFPPAARWQFSGLRLARDA